MRRQISGHKYGGLVKCIRVLEEKCNNSVEYCEYLGIVSGFFEISRLLYVLRRNCGNSSLMGEILGNIDSIVHDLRPLLDRRTYVRQANLWLESCMERLHTTHSYMAGDECITMLEECTNKAIETVREICSRLA